MPRNSATSTLQLGLLSCKVGANPAADKPAGFSNICDDGHPIAKTRMGSLSCPVCSGPPTGKARVIGKDQLVKIDQAMLDEAAEEAKRFKGAIDLRVHPADQVTDMLPAPDGKVYTLSPYDAAAQANYLVIREVVRKHAEWCFSCVWTVSTVAARYRLQEYKGALILVELARPEAIRQLPALDGTPNEALLPMAEQFVGTLVADYDPESYKDVGRERLEAAIAASQAVPSSTTTGVPVPAPAMDLMAQLQAAVAAAQGQKVAA